jgi:topoisomerase IV subunit A
MIYLDGKSGKTFAKRFNVSAITRGTDYDLTQGSPNSKCLYFSVNANSESEIVNIQLTQSSSARVKSFDFDFSELAIKGRSSQGNTVTKYPVRKIVQTEIGKSSIGAQKAWIDEVSGKINSDSRGKYLGEFDTGTSLIVLYKDGAYEINELDTTKRYELNDILSIEKFDPEMVLSAVYFDGNKDWTMVKRFKIETTNTGQKYSFITEHKNSKLLFASLKKNPKVEYSMKVNSKKMDGEITIADFIDVKGWKALGNKLSDSKLLAVKEIEEELSNEDSKNVDLNNGEEKKLNLGDTFELDF